MDSDKYVADQKAQLEADRVKRKEAHDLSDKNKAEELRARIAELEGNVADRSEVQVLQDRVKELERISPDPDAEIKAKLAADVADAIAAERNFLARPKPLTKAEADAKKLEDDAAAAALKSRSEADRVRAERGPDQFGTQTDQAARDNRPR